MAIDVRSPLVLGADSDPDPGTPRNRANRQTLILDEQSIAQQVQPVLCQRDPHRSRQISGPAAELAVRESRGIGRPPPVDRAGAAAAHDGDAVERVERTHEDGCGKARAFGHDVHQAVNAVIQVDVRVSGLAIKRLVPSGPTRRRMTGRIGLANVRLDLDDDTAGDDAAAAMHEDLTQEIARDVERRPVVKIPSELHENQINRGGRKARRVLSGVSLRSLWSLRSSIPPFLPFPSCLPYLPAAYACDRPSASTVRR